MRTLFSLLVLHFVLLWLAPRANAAGGAVGGAVGVVVTGEASLRAPLAAQLETWLREHGHAPATASLPADVLAAVQACLARSDESCARQVVDKRVDAETLVLANVEVTAGDDGTRNITLTGYWFRQGREAIADRRYCERCTEQTLRHAANELMVALSKSSEHTTGRLSLTSSPGGAKVLINGSPVGVTPLEFDLAPGNHQLSLSASGHEIETRQVAMRGGETTRLDVPLVPRDESSPSRSRGVLPLGMIITGGALAITGGILIFADEDPSASPSAPLEIRNTGPLGVALAATGGAVIVVGAILWVRRGRDAGPVASVSGDAAYFGWAGRF